MKTKFLLLATVTLLSFSQVNANNGHKDAIAKNTATAQDYCGVTDKQICQYMAEFGYYVISLSPIQGSCNVYAKTTVGKNFIVYISNGIITGYDESNM